MPENESKKTGILDKLLGSVLDALPEPVQRIWEVISGKRLNGQEISGDFLHRLKGVFFPNVTPDGGMEYQQPPSDVTHEVSVQPSTVPGTRADRDNNPLNIKLPSGGLEVARQRYGDPKLEIDPKPASDGGFFLKFSDPTLGLKAGLTLLRRGYNDLEFGAAMKRWSGGGYGSEIAPMYAGKKIAQISDAVILKDILPPQARREGYSGKVNLV